MRALCTIHHPDIFINDSLIFFFQNHSVCMSYKFAFYSPIDILKNINFLNATILWCCHGLMFIFHISIYTCDYALKKQTFKNKISCSKTQIDCTENQSLTIPQNDQFCETSEFHIKILTDFIIEKSSDQWGCISKLEIICLMIIISSYKSN